MYRTMACAYREAMAFIESQGLVMDQRKKEEEAKRMAEKVAHGWLKPGTIKPHELEEHYDNVVST